MDSSTLTSLTGSLMSLFGILVSLFSIHLGNWLSRLQGIKAKWDSNQGNLEPNRQAQRECRYDFIQTYNFQPFVMTPIIIGFAVLVGVFFHQIRSENSINFPCMYITIFNLFFGIMIALSGFLLYCGWRIGSSLGAEIRSKFAA